MIADRVEESTLTAGLGAYALAGATAGHRRFGAHFANGAAVRYCAESEDRLVWEIGIGIYNADAMTRDTVLLSSGGAGVAINWGAGAKRVWSNADAALLDLARTALQPSSIGETVQAQSGAYTWADRPDAAANSGKIITVTDVGGRSSWYSDGVRWKAQNGILLLDNSGAQVTAPLDANQNTLYTKTVPGGALGTHGALRISGALQWTSNANNKTWVVFYGTAFYQFVVSTSGGGTEFTVIVTNRGAPNSQEVSGHHSVVLQGQTSLTYAVNSLAGQDVMVKVQKAVGGEADAAILHRLTIELLTP